MLKHNVLEMNVPKVEGPTNTTLQYYNLAVLILGRVKLAVFRDLLGDNLCEAVQLNSHCFMRFMLL